MCFHLCVFLWIFQNFLEHVFQKHLWTVAFDSTYILHKKSNKIIQKPDWPFLLFWNIKSLYFNYFHSFSFVHHSLSFAVTHCHFVLLVVIRNHSLLFVITRCTTRCHSLSLVATRLPIVCLFISNREQEWVWLF